MQKAQEIKDRAMQIQKMKAVRNAITFLAVVISCCFAGFCYTGFYPAGGAFVRRIYRYCNLSGDADLYMGNKLSHITRNAVH